MRIGFDAKRIFHNATGLGNYSRTFVKNLLRFHPQLEYYLYTPNPPAIHADFPGATFNNLHIRTGKAAIPALWRSFGIKKNLLQDSIDIYHGLSHEIPFGLQKTPIKTVVTIHDLIFKRYPEFYDSAQRKIYDYKFRYACKNADAIVAISESTATDIQELYGIEEDKISVIYQACDDIFYETPAEDIAKSIADKYKLPNEYMLYVGTINERKNLMLVLQAMVLQKDKIDIPLFVIGSGGEYQKKVINFITENGLKERVRLLQGVTTTELPIFYRKALIFIYPSFYEGFGLPITEALLSGTPVIAANTSSLPEAGGPATLYVNPGNTEEMADAIASLLMSDSLRKKMSEEGRQYAKKFDRDIITEEIVGLYKKLQKNLNNLE